MPNSKVEKGKRFEKSLAEQIRESGLDSRASRESGSGNGLRKGDINSSIEFLLEAKNEKGVPAWLLNRIDQAKRQAEKGWKWREKWALVLRDPRSPERASEEYAVIEFSQFLDLLKRASEPKLKDPDKSLSWKLKDLKRSVNAVINEIDG